MKRLSSWEQKIQLATLNKNTIICLFPLLSLWKVHYIHSPYMYLEGMLNSCRGSR